MVDKRVVNVLLNGFGVMMAYAGMLGGAILMPTIFKDMNVAGLSENSAFYGFIICNAAVVFFGPFTPSIHKLLGTRTSVVISVLLCGTINNVLLYPTQYLVYVAFLLNGIGCALLRVAALAYMTKNSTRKTLSRNNSIHWMMLTVGLMLGSSIVMFINFNSTQITRDIRFEIAIAMSVVSLCAIPGYFFTQRIPPDYDSVQTSTPARALEEEPPNEATWITSSFSRDTPAYPDGGTVGGTVGVLYRLREMWHVLLRNETLVLLAPMFAAGVYCTAYSPIIPTAVGTVAKRPWIVSAFGILTGCGQLCGAFLTGAVIDRISIRKIAVVTSALSVLTFALIALVVNMGFTSPWDEWTDFSTCIILVLAFFVGACDMSNNVCLTVAIGRVYRRNVDPAFSLFITVMSCSMVLWYVLSTMAHSALYIILGLYSAVSVCTAISFSSIDLSNPVLIH